jgi:hypothetical protein
MLMDMKGKSHDCLQKGCSIKGMILGLHSLLFMTKVKAATAIMSLNQAHDPLIKLRLTNRVGGSS